MRLSASDSLFLLLSSDEIVIIVYIEDILIMGDNNRIDILVNEHRHFFVITDMGRPTHFLGVKISFRSDVIFLSQTAYIRKVIKMANMTNSKPAKHPLPMSHPLHEDIMKPSHENIKEMEGIRFRSVLEALSYFRLQLVPIFLLLSV